MYTIWILYLHICKRHTKYMNDNDDNKQSVILNDDNSAVSGDDSLLAFFPLHLKGFYI